MIRIALQCNPDGQASVAKLIFSSMNPKEYPVFIKQLEENKIQFTIAVERHFVDIPLEQFRSFKDFEEQCFAGVDRYTDNVPSLTKTEARNVFLMQFGYIYDDQRCEAGEISSEIRKKISSRYPRATYAEVVKKQTQGSSGVVNHATLYQLPKVDTATQCSNRKPSIEPQR